MIEINNLTSTLVGKGLLKKTADVVLKGENRKNSYLSIALIGTNRMKDLNKRYLNRNYPTDVLVFPETKDFSVEETLGEVIICLQTVKKNARKYNLPFQKELGRVLIHGILHLLGYGHEKSPKKAEKMKRKEDYYFKKIF